MQQKEGGRREKEKETMKGKGGKKKGAGRTVSVVPNLPRATQGRSRSQADS